MFECVKSVFGVRRHWLGGVAVAALLATSAQAQATYSVDVRPTGLEPALLALASQTHQQIIFAKSIVAGRRAPAVKGVLTPEQAVAQLLAGSNLRARRVSAKLIVVERITATASAGSAEGQGTRPFDVASLGPGVADVPMATSDQAAPTAPAHAEPTLLDEVRVTGSNLRGVPTASPIIVLDRDALERSGQTTVADALRALPANFGGGAGEGNTNAGGDRLARNGSFGSALNLRGLGNNATLVLINGRRMAGSGTFGDFSDVSMIPSAAVERVEVLLDGASAVYGSDAVGGVVNIIMRKDFDGAESRLLAGIGTRGEPAEGQVSHTAGVRWRNGGVVISYELQRRDRLSGDDRRIAADADLRPFGGTDQRLTFAYPGNILVTDPVTRALVPGFAIPGGQNGVGLRPDQLLRGVVNRGNQRKGQDVLPRQTRNAVYVALDQDVGDRVELTGDLRLSARRFKSLQFPVLSTFSVSAANPFYVSATGAPSQSISYSFSEDLPNPTIAGTVESFGATLGGVVRLGAGWRSEAYGTFAQETYEARTGGQLNSLILAEALGNVADRADTPYSPIRDGYFNPFSGIPGATPSTVLGLIGSGSTSVRNRSRVASASLQADGGLWDLPGGSVKLALGAQARRETLDRTGSNFLSTLAPVPTTPTDVARDVFAAFAEARIPIIGVGNARPGLERLELSVAARVEHYEDVGSTTNPRIGLLWQPTSALQVRATYGRSFRAPALRETYDAPNYSPAMLALGTARILSLNLGGGNKDLKPETAESWTVGLDYRPTQLPGLLLSLTGYDVRFHDRIDRPVSANLANVLSDPTLTAFVTRISPATNAADRALITSLLTSGFLSTAQGTFPAEAYGAIVDNRYVNTATLRVRGLDLTGGYTTEIGGDRLSLSANATYMLDYDQQVTPTSPRLSRVDVVGFPVRVRGRATADWTRGRVTLGGAVNVTGAYKDALGARIGDLVTFDAQARLAAATSGSFKGVDVLLNVRNVFDRNPPFYNNSIGVAYDPALGDPVGRFVSLQLKRAW